MVVIFRIGLCCIIVIDDFSDVAHASFFKWTGGLHSPLKVNNGVIKVKSCSIGTSEPRPAK